MQKAVKMNKIRVLIVSQQVLLRQGLEFACSSMRDIEILGAADFNNGIALALDESPPDVAQASAYFSKEVTPDELVNTIRRVAGGEHPINESLTTKPEVADQVLQQFQKLSAQSETEDFVSPLTQRETEILNYITLGYQNKQIAVALDISEQTIKNHVTSILRKLNANARTEAVVVGLKQGLISLD
jgi:DNA-binding NarL/FixJ family response regulator